MFAIPINMNRVTE